MEEARVPIPIVGGIDDSTDPLALRPPNLATSENTKMPRRGAVAKRHGWGGLLDTVTGSGMVAAGQDRLLSLGASGGRVVNPDGTLVDLSTSASPPVVVDRFDVAAPQGYVHSAQVAASENYACVVWSFIGNVNATEPANASDTTTPTQVEGDFEVAAAIVDADLRVVWGPHTMPSQLQWLPRVEPVGDGQFVVFALGNTAMSGTSALVTSEAPSLYAVRYDVNTAVGTVGNVGEVAPGGGQLYDTTTTYPDLATDMALVALNHDAGSGTHRLRVVGITSSIGTPADIAISEASSHDVAIFWDTDTSTVLVYEGGDKLVHYSDSSLSFSSVAAPTMDYLRQAASTSTFGQLYDPGPASQRPTFYYDGSQLLLNEIPVTLTGTAPATPSFGTADTVRLPMVFEPAMLGSQLMYVAAHGPHHVNGSGSLRYSPGARAFSLYFIDSDDRYAPVVSLGESRLGDPGHRCFQWIDANITTVVYSYAGSTWITPNFPAVRGQVASFGGGLVYPLPLLTQAQNARGASDDPVEPGSTTASMYGGASRNVQNGAGFYNDEQVVALVRVRQSAATNTVARLGRARVLAMGGLRVWSSERAFHTGAVRRPRLGPYIDPDASSTYYARRVATSAMGVNPSSTTGTGEIKWEGAWFARVVLVVTDAAGLQYRSPPSNRTVGWARTTDDTPTYCYVFPVFPEFDVVSLIDAGLNVDAELYVTARAEGTPTTEADVDDTAYTLVGRVPLQYDSDGYYVLDTLNDYARFLDASLGWGYPTELPPRNATSLYTASELESSPPPATNVIARAGEYLFLVPSEEPTELWYSKPLVAGRAPEWSPLLSTVMPPEAGAIVSLGGTYDRLLVLCENGVWELPAIGGPDASGSGSFPAPRLVYEGDPCVSHMGTVSTPSGVFYVSRTGPKLIAGDGTQQDVGRAVADQATWSAVVDSVYHEGANEVIWFTSSYAVVLNTLSGAWSTVNTLTASADVMAGTLYRINQAGNLRAESASSTTDGAAYPLATITTGWVDLGDEMAMKRFNEITLLGRLENTPTMGSLIVKIAYDYDDTVVDTYTWNWTDVPVSATNTFQLEVHPTVSKVDSMKITVTEGTTTVGQTTGNDALWTLAGIEARVRSKAGLTKRPATGKK